MNTQEQPRARSVGVRSRTSYLLQSGGVNAEAVDWHSEGQSHFDLTVSQYRVGFVLEQSSGFCETRTNPGVRGGYVHGGRPFITLSPPDMRVWACSDGIRFTRSVSLSFDRAALVEQLADDFSDNAITPRLNFESPQLASLAQLLAAECRSPGAYGSLYAQSLINALLIGLIRLRPPGTKVTSRLSPWQLRIATEYMQTHSDDGLLLSELAAATGLSASHFSRAFKASTGLPPYQWHLNFKISRAQELLLKNELSLAQIAAVTGFADQPHFTRAFARATGATPAAWQKDRRR